MVDKNLQGIEAQKEEVKQTPKVEAEKSTATETKPTVEKLKTQEDFDRAVSKASETFSQKAALSQTEAEAQKVRADKAEGLAQKGQAEIENLMAFKFQDTPDELEAWKRSRRDAEVAERTRLQGETNERERILLAASYRALSLSQEHGIPIDELKATTEMEVLEKANAWFTKSRKAEPKPEEKEETPKIDPAVSTAEGSANFERIRDDMIKNPSNDAIMRRYLEAKKERDSQK